MRDISLRGWGLQSEAVYQGTDGFSLNKFKLFLFRNHHCFSLELPLSLPQLAPRQTETLKRLNLKKMLEVNASQQVEVEREGGMERGVTWDTTS